MDPSRKADCQLSHCDGTLFKHKPEAPGWPRRGRSRSRHEWLGRRRQPHWPGPRHTPRFLSSLPPEVDFTNF
jgi:hypothetical protein